MPLELLEPSDLAPGDFADPYDLPDTVDTTIPRSAQPDEPTAHWTARGLLAETCDRLGGQPLSLDYIQQTYTTFIAACVILPPSPDGSTGQDAAETALTVALVLPRVGCRWTLLLNHHTIGAGAGLLPSPRWLADRIETAYNEDDYR